jgi:hypothetical protein
MISTPALCTGRRASNFSAACPAAFLDAPCLGKLNSQSTQKNQKADCILPNGGNIP